MARPADQSITGGQRVGLASYDLHDPAGTFQPIESFRPPPAPGPLSALAWLGWPLRLLLAWLVNLGALAAAGLIVTNVGPADPLAYVEWSVAFGILNVGPRLGARLRRSPLAPIVSAVALPLLLNLLVVWLMTVVAPPSHAPDLPSIAKAAMVMWLANLPLRLLVRRRR